MIGLGGLNIAGSVGGRGRQLIRNFREVPGVRIAALCDCDRAGLEDSVQTFKKRGEKPAAYHDPRQVFDDRSIDAVAIALPNFWHALATIWACQAGKDVYVEKPFAYNLWEGRQAVAAAKKYGRIVQTGCQGRSSEAHGQALEYIRRGELGTDALRPRDRLPRARADAKSQRPDEAARHAGLRPLVRAIAQGPDPPQATALRLALVLGDRQWRDRQQRRAHGRRRPLVPRPGRPAPALHQFRPAIRL